MDAVSDSSTNELDIEALEKLPLMGEVTTTRGMHLMGCTSEVNSNE